MLKERLQYGPFSCGVGRILMDDAKLVWGALTLYTVSMVVAFFAEHSLMN